MKNAFGMVALALGLWSCASTPPPQKLDTRIPRHTPERSAASTWVGKAKRKPAWAWGSKSSANVLVCQLPGSNMIFAFSYVNNMISDKDGYQRGVSGLAFSATQSSSNDYDFSKDQYRIIGTDSDGLLNGGVFDDGYSEKGKAVAKFEVNASPAEEGAINKGLLIESVQANFAHTGKKPVFTGLTADLYHNKMQDAYNVVLGKNGFEYVKQTVTFKPADCKGDLDNIWTR